MTGPSGGPGWTRPSSGSGGAVRRRASAVADAGRALAPPDPLSPQARLPRRELCRPRRRDEGRPAGVPYAFLKPPTTTLTGSGSDVAVCSASPDERLGGRAGRRHGPEGQGRHQGDALDYVAGYAVINDVSARYWVADKPELGIDWVMQKRPTATGRWAR